LVFQILSLLLHHCHDFFPLFYSYKYGNEENELLHTLNHHKKSCRVLSFNHDGALLFSASKDKSVVITDTETMTVTQSFRKAHE
jgi:WD40 repeat protein